MGPPEVWRKLVCILFLIAGIARAQGLPEVRSGVLTVVWGDPSPGSAQAPRLLGLLTGADGKTVQIELAPTPDDMEEQRLLIENLRAALATARP